jgi:hypothetical protein
MRQLIRLTSCALLMGCASHSWGAEGPLAGFFPFYVSLIVLISCVVNVVSVLRVPDNGKLFAEWSQLRQVVSVLVPTAIYVAWVPYIGIYAASGLLIGFFMIWFGRYNWLFSIGIAVLVPVLTFLMFEIWFLVPLPKGPIEHLFGL